MEIKLINKLIKVKKKKKQKISLRCLIEQLRSAEDARTPEPD
jgi:hypothetical protein